MAGFQQDSSEVKTESCSELIFFFQRIKLRSLGSSGFSGCMDQVGIMEECTFTSRVWMDRSQGQGFDHDDDDKAPFPTVLIMFLDHGNCGQTRQ